LAKQWIVLRTWRRLLMAVTSVAAYDEEVAIRQQGSRCPGIADN